MEKNPGSLTISENRELDQIYASDGRFTIHRMIPQEGRSSLEYLDYPDLPSNLAVSSNNIAFSEGTTSLIDLGSAYLFENSYYKIKLGKNSPILYYLGTKMYDILGEGYAIDAITLIQDNEANPDYVECTLDEMEYPNASVSRNQIVYHTIIADKVTGEPWATCAIEFTFFERAIRKKVMIAHDWRESPDKKSMKVWYTESFFSPSLQFEFTDLREGDPITTSRTIYRSQDLIALKDRKISDVFIQGADIGLFKPFGIFKSFGSSAPYPSRISYKGDLNYEYSTINTDIETSLNTGEPVVFEEYWAVGTPRSARDNAEWYSSISLWDYPNGMVPGALIGHADEWTNVSALQALTRSLDEIAVPYLIAYPPGTFSEKRPDFVYIGNNSQRVNGSEQYNGNQSIYDKIKSPSLKGIFFENFKYSQNIFPLLQERGVQYVVGVPVPPPIYDTSIEGMRLLKDAYYHGKKTDIILMPVSLPTSLLLRPAYNAAEGVFAHWSAATNILRETGGIGVFDADPGDLLMRNENEDLLRFLISSQKKNVTFMDPAVLTEYYQDLKNIRVTVNRTIDRLNVNVTNMGTKNVEGVTIRAIMPKLPGNITYTVDNGKTIFQDVRNTSVILYAGVSLVAGEKKDITIRPAEELGRLIVDLKQLAQGRNLISVKGPDDHQLIQGAIVTMDNTSYVTDETGQISIWMRRGLHNFSIEKPGYTKLEFSKEVKGKIFRILAPWIGN
jgi:hypothetical protein